MKLPAAIRTRSDGDWYKGAHFGRLEIGHKVMNSLTKVSKDTLVVEIYEQQAEDTEGAFQQGVRILGIVPQQQVEQRGRVADVLAKRGNDIADNGTPLQDDRDI